MEVKFDLVRIGKIRKSYELEKTLKDNVVSLKKDIRFLLENEICNNKSNIVEMAMIIPEKGKNIKIALEDVRDFHIRKKLKTNFPNSIYQGKYAKILDNINNRIF
ncbi:hypothetical protein KO566_04555 [Flavobacteriaceae bacterium XHP0103]|uniref:hypothetical protein n=1 Tax=Marixanthotalea marina TaxID=2844359 RepID=UPI002989C615|nr:hypothetical protein [Marixanthotalea marina]MBU3821323.1 hypothetical protein [Marixanthotalea marina]